MDRFAPFGAANSWTHWETVYKDADAETFSWYSPNLAVSLEMIAAAEPDRNAPILDVGSGASGPAAGLLALGYTRITLLDISQAALDAAKARLGDAPGTAFLQADITTVELPESSVALWHDRAVLHFLIKEEDRRTYVRNLLHAVKPGGHAVVAVFGPEGPTMCSNLPTMRWDLPGLAAVFGAELRPVESRLQTHVTPAGKTQQFLYACFKRA